MTKTFDVDLFLFDYQGYGKSLGRPGQESIIRDGVRCYDHLRRRGYKNEQILVCGESLGGSVAVYIAHKRDCKQLILISTFTTLVDVVKYHSKKFGIIGMIGSLFYSTLPSKNWIPHVKCPIIIFHSPDDNLIPFYHAEILYRKISHDNKMLVRIKGNHSTPVLEVGPLRMLADFISKDNAIQDKDIQDLVDSVKIHIYIKGYQ